MWTQSQSLPASQLTSPHPELLLLGGFLFLAWFWIWHTDAGCGLSPAHLRELNQCTGQWQLPNGGVYFSLCYAKQFMLSLKVVESMSPYKMFTVTHWWCGRVCVDWSMCTCLRTGLVVMYELCICCLMLVLCLWQVMQKLGKSIETRDEQFEHCSLNLTKQQVWHWALQNTHIFPGPEPWLCSVRQAKGKCMTTNLCDSRKPLCLVNTVQGASLSKW